MIKISNLNKAYSKNTVFTDFNLEIQSGKITVILGESGCGKTTLLNAIAGLTDYQGEIVGVPQKKAFVFQENRLINCLTVKQNLALVCKEENLEQDLKDFGLFDKKNEYPKNLSGGMARRVAILRALSYQAPIIFMDEPFINLDLKLKDRLMTLVKKAQKEKGVTLIMVTHSLSEAIFMADRIIVLPPKEGKIDEYLDLMTDGFDKTQLRSKLYEFLTK